MSSKSKSGAKKTGAKKASTKTAGTKRVAQPVWTREKAENARRNGQYIKLGDKRGNLAITGAKAMFTKEKSWLYVPALRVAGNRQDVERVLGELVQAGAMQSGDVKDALAGAYRAGSENSPAFLEEVEELKAMRASGKTAGKAKGAELPRSIAFYAEALDTATVESKTGGTERKARSPKKGAKKTAKKGAKKSKSASPKARKSKSASPKARKSKSKSASPKAKRGSPKGKRGAKPLAEKLEALAEGKVMDVSNLHVDGSGAKVVAQPGSKSKKVLVPGTRLVSDKKNGIKAAAKLLGDEELVQRWMDAKEGGGAEAEAEEGSRSRSSSPARTHTMSPRPLSPAGTNLPPLPSAGRASSPRGSGISLPKVPYTVGSPRS